MPIAPKKSREYNLLLQLVDQVGLSTRVVRNILWLINAHEQLIGFPIAFKRLHHILTQLQIHANVRLADYGIENWPAVLLTIIGHTNEWVSKFPNPRAIIPSEDSSKDNPMSYKGLDKNGFYSSLFLKHKDQQSSEKKNNYLRFTLLQGHFLLSHILAMRALIPIKQYESYTGVNILGKAHSGMYRASKTLRDLSWLENNKQNKIHKITPPFKNKSLAVREWLVVDVNLCEGKKTGSAAFRFMMTMTLICLDFPGKDGDTDKFQV